MNDFLSAAEIDALVRSGQQRPAPGREPRQRPGPAHALAAHGRLQPPEQVRHRPAAPPAPHHGRLLRLGRHAAERRAPPATSSSRSSTPASSPSPTRMESVPESSVAAVVETAGGDTKMIMTAELILVLEVIERLLGGTGDSVSERALTDIERVLARRLFGAFVECLSATWYDVCAESLELGRIDPLGEGPQIVPGSEPTLVITVEARLARRSTTLALLVPWVDGGARRGRLRQPRRGRRPAPTTRAPPPPCAPGCARSTSTCAPRSAETHLAARRRARAAARRRGQARRDGRRRHGRLRRRRARPPRPRRALGRPPRDPDPRALRGGDAMSADGPLLIAWASRPRRRSSAPCRTPLPAPRASAPSSPVTAPSRPVEQAVHGLAVPAVCAEVSYVDGVTGGNVFLLPVEGARRLAASMMGDGAAPRPEGAELSELELSAVGEAMNQMMSAAALATSGVLGQEVEIAPPEIRVVTTEAEAAEILRASAAPHVLTVELHGGRRLRAARPARPQRLRRADGPRAGRADHRVHDRPAGRARCAPSRCACGPSSAARGCRPARRWTCPPARSSSSTARSRIPSTSTSTACTSPPAACGWPRTAASSSRSRQVLGLQHGAGAVAELAAPPAPAPADERPRRLSPRRAEPRTEPEVAEAVTRDGRRSSTS